MRKVDKDPRVFLAQHAAFDQSCPQSIDLLTNIMCIPHELWQLVFHGLFQLKQLLDNPGYSMFSA